MMTFLPKALAYYLVFISQATGYENVNDVEITSNDLLDRSSLRDKPDDSLLPLNSRVFYQHGVGQDLKTFLLDLSFTFIELVQFII